MRYAYVLVLIVALGTYAFSLAGGHPGDLKFLLRVGALVAVPLFVYGVLVRYFVLRCIHPFKPWTQAVLHLCAGTVLSLALFLVLMSALSLPIGESAATLFRGPAAIWQLAHCAGLYGCIAFIAELEAHRRPAQASLAGDGVKGGCTTDVVADSDTCDDDGAHAVGDGLVFVRNGSELTPILIARIVYITGARDYAEVITIDGTHLLRTSLAELEQKLGSGFLRVHRSTIVKMDQIDRVEPAGGGRLLLHLLNGDAVNASRAGAKRIRELML
ncbi:MAG: LytTR family DNA-binding domain-containing protein [Pseudomonadota bacterium]